MNKNEVLYCLLWEFPCLSSTEWASWSQAILSAASIIATICLVAWQIKSKRKDQINNSLLAASGILTYSDQMIGAINAINEIIRDNIQKKSYSAKQSETLLYIAKTIPLPEREDLYSLNKDLPEVAIKLSQCKNSIMQIITAVEKTKNQDSEKMNDYFYGNILILGCSIEENLKECKIKLDTYCR